MFYPTRLALRIIFTLFLSFVSFSTLSEELIIKFSSSIDDNQSIELLSDYNLEIVEKIDELNICTVEVPNNENVDDLINLLESDTRTEYVEKNLSSGQGAFLPNDEFFEDQWHHATIDSERAWDITRGSSDVIIAVLDSGLQRENVDFSGARFLSGFDFVNNDDNPDDDLGHGTYVTGLIAANANNGVSGVGVDHNARILPVKVINEDNFGTTFDLVQGISYAVSQNVDVINMSLGGYPNANSLNDALSLARQNNIIMIASAGNGGIGDADEHYPGASPLTISVGSTDINNNRAFSSSTGQALDVVAPGSVLRTTSYNDDDGMLDFFNGTSAAAPLVSGVASLARSLDTDISQQEFLEILTLTSQDQVGSSSEDTFGRDDFFGWGLINARAALEKVNPNLPVAPTRIQAQDFTENFDSTPNNLGDDSCSTGSADSQATSDLNGVCNIAWTTSGEWLEYNFFVEQAGIYDISLRLASLISGTVSADIDGTEIRRLEVSTGGWQNYSDHAFSTQLSRGAHTIRVNFIDGNVNFNFFDLKLIGIAVPAKIAAENFQANFDTTPGNIGDSVCDTGNTDSQLTSDDTGLCNIAWTTPGEWLEYDVLVENPGTYFINLRLASLVGGDISLEVNGNEVDRVSVNTDNWQNFEDHIIATQLNEGIQTIRINFVDGNVNFNFLEVLDNTDITITPSKDTFIRGGAFANDNFGSDERLVLKNDNSDEYTRTVYLQFRINEFDEYTSQLNVQRAIIRLYASRVDESLNISLHRIVANNAPELGITKNNMPIEGSEVAVTTIFSSANDRYYEWDVTDYFKEKSTYNTFNVLFRENNQIDEFIEFNSRNADSNPPQLVVTYGN